MSFFRIKIFPLAGAVLATAGILIGCSAEKKCKFKPSPIFEAGLPHILQYNFEKSGPQSLESLFLDTGVLLEIHQDVCTETIQEYRFVVKGDYGAYADSLWIKEASKQLVYLSSVSPKQSALKAWADVIESQRSDLRLGEEKQVQPGIYVKVDRVISTGESTLLLTFTQR